MVRWWLVVTSRADVLVKRNGGLQINAVPSILMILRESPRIRHSQGRKGIDLGAGRERWMFYRRRMPVENMVLFVVLLVE